eukprot:755676-Hanusia_phi.AAC.1
MEWTGTVLAAAACVAVIGCVSRIPYDSITLVGEAKLTNDNADIELDLKKYTAAKARIQSELDLKEKPLDNLHFDNTALEAVKSATNSNLIKSVAYPHVAFLSYSCLGSTTGKAKHDMQDKSHEKSTHLKSALAASKVKSQVPSNLNPSMSSYCFKSLARKVYPKFGGSTRAIRDSEIQSDDCLPPKVLIDGVCQDDPEGTKPPALCSNKHSEACEKWRVSNTSEETDHTLQEAAKEKLSYNNDEYSGHWHYKPGYRHRYRVIPQRYPHRDRADLGDNYISGFSDKDYESRELDDAFIRRTRTPILFRPVTGFRDTDLTG